jgi:hypothetical protein
MAIESSDDELARFVRDFSDVRHEVCAVTHNYTTFSFLELLG